jgi:hypothetical protein
MNLTGPIPKRVDQLAGHVAKDKIESVDKVAMEGEVKQPSLRQFPNMLTQNITKAFWESLGQSGQAKYYEPSDWMTALTALHLLDKQLRPYEDKDGKMKVGQVSPTMVAAVWQMLTSIAVTEGERRRLRIEVDRSTGEVGEEAKVIPISKVYEDRLRAQQQA